MDCTEIKETLSAYIDGEIGGDEKTLVEEHLRSCKGCDVFLSELKKSVAQVKKLDEEDPPPWLKQRVMAMVEEEPEKTRGFFPGLFPQFLMPRPIHALATVLILLTSVYIFQAIKKEATIMRTPVGNEGISTLSRKNEDMYYGRDVDRYRSLSDEYSSREKALPQSDDRMEPASEGEYAERISQEALREDKVTPPAEPERRDSSEKSGSEAIKKDDTGSGMLGKSAAPKTKEAALPAKVAGAPPRAAMKAKAAEEAGGEMGTPAGIIRTIAFTITVEDLTSAREEVENVLEGLGKMGMRKKTTGRVEAFYRLSLARTKLAELRQHLEEIGTVEEKTDYGTGPDEEDVEITIELELPPSVPGSSR